MNEDVLYKPWGEGVGCVCPTTGLCQARIQPPSPEIKSKLSKGRAGKGRLQKWKRKIKDKKKVNIIKALENIIFLIIFGKKTRHQFLAELSPIGKNYCSSKSHFCFFYPDFCYLLALWRCPP